MADAGAEPPGHGQGLLFQEVIDASLDEDDGPFLLSHCGEDGRRDCNVGAEYGLLPLLMLTKRLTVSSEA